MEPIVQASDQNAQTNEQQSRVIKVVPHNPRLATESAARIFQSIQEGRKQPHPELFIVSNEPVRVQPQLVHGHIPVMSVPGGANGGGGTASKFAPGGGVAM
ncbi:hypothetical protein LWI29_029337 [Acer saccharum]|uniref:Uncharacterized protein n=1 Tax=Acer saccharum TaxID=4024 RepID=A0AA39W0B7_ACESA|nr:hypothetical protein LWI29_029337 [Acer saccharum]